MPGDSVKKIRELLCHIESVSVPNESSEEIFDFVLLHR